MKFKDYLQAGLAIIVVFGLILGMGYVTGHPAHAQTTGSGGIISPTYLDPCQSSSIAKLSVPVNISTATTTQLVAASGSTAIYVCGFSATFDSVVTTATTAQFEAGTGGTCGSSTVLLTGLLNAGNITAGPAVAVTFADPGTTMRTAASSGLCVVSAGATVQIQGVLTYVQQ